MPSFRLIPSIDALLQQPGLRAARDRVGHAVALQAARRAADELRESLERGELRAPRSPEQALAWLDTRAAALAAEGLRPSLRRVLNATGVILHTNLGRAPLAAEALRQAADVAGGFANLEYDLEAGTRGDRTAHAERLLTSLTGAEAAVVANNNAAATLLVLAALAAGREVIVSRGELVEIGGGFRVPDVLAQSGALLREVGTTNRTRVADYAAALSERTALILRVHPSNFRVEGFTERPAVTELAALGRRFSVPCFEDLGSGWLGLPDVPTPLALRDEPSVAGSVRDGADLVAFSGDKLLGGPQAGLVVGRRDLVDRLRRHPLMRAVRADKVTYAALEATLSLWAAAPRRSEIPVYRMLTLPAADLDRRARAVAARLATLAGTRVEVVDGESTTGGGSAPASALPTRLVAIRSDALGPDALDARLRRGAPPVVARIDRDRLVLDLRTVYPDDDAALADALVAALSEVDVTET